MPVPKEYEQLAPQIEALKIGPQKTKLQFSRIWLSLNKTV
jgi:hypothetical protein